MPIPTRLKILLAAPLALAACGSEADNTYRNDTAMTADMPMMQSGETGVTASAEGTVTKIDATAGTITIDHGPVPEAGWPAMTMGFTADPAQRASVTEGDKVNFTFRKTEGGGEIVSLAKK
ncbi:copper-binding protein [Novosphingobium pentaromativorans]|jgi:Cu(I)/Ag(I) efflux system protein CusF